MQVKQISVFVENRAGRLEKTTAVLAEANINIRALSLADTSDFGILRLIVDKPAEAEKALHEAGFTVRTTDVIACMISDKPGGLHEMLTLFANLGVSIEYMYAFFTKQTDRAIMIIRVEEPEKAIQILHKGGVELLRGEQVYSM